MKPVPVVPVPDDGGIRFYGAGSYESSFGATPFFFMTQDSTSTLDRLLALSAEAEQILAQTVGSEDIRDAFAIVRGHLDLARMYSEPIQIDDLERLLARIASSIGGFFED